MAEITKVGFQLGSSLASKHLTDAEYVKGGYFVVDTYANLTAKDSNGKYLNYSPSTATEDGTIVEGSLCYVTNEAKFYQYNGTAWVVSDFALTSDLPYISVNHDSLENNSVNNILSYIYDNHTASFGNSKVSFLVNGHTLYNFNNIFSNTWTINEIYLLTGTKSDILVQSENGALTELVNLDQLDSLNLVGYDTVVKTHYATGLAYDLKGFGNDSYYGIDYTNNYPVISTQNRNIGITTSAKDPSLGGNEQEVSWFYFPEVDEGVVATEQYVQDYVKDNGASIEIVDLTV